MTTSKDALHAALRDIVGPAARAHGFTGSAPTWRKANEHGDWAVVSIQRSQFGSRDHVTCVVNLSLVPAACLDKMALETGRRPPKPHDHHGLLRWRLHPTGSPDGHDIWWDVPNPEQAATVSEDIVRRLDEDGWAPLDQLLDRETLLGVLRKDDPRIFGLVPPELS